MIFHENCLPADDSHEIPCLYFLKSSKICNCRLLQIVGCALWVNTYSKCLKFRLVPFLFINKMLVIKSGTNKILVRVTKSKDTQTAS